ncbi:MAG: hypothetical protein Ct9H300mP28_32380 [Pseudomonadota bacterium]|nr:MAG: hypothetical protein Ct9H300mP28_32380 [Pseudomonadota bacterium]
MTLTGKIAGLEEEIKTFACDVSDSTAVDTMFQQIENYGLDILVNNAGIAGPPKLIENITDDEWRDCMAVCIDSQFYCTRPAVPIFKQQKKGVIINLISGAGIKGYPQEAHTLQQNGQLQAYKIFGHGTWREKYE